MSALRVACEHGLFDEHRHHEPHQLRYTAYGVVPEEYVDCVPEDCNSSFAWVQCSGGRDATPADLVAELRRMDAIDYEAAIGAFDDTPYVTCGECLGDGQVVVTDTEGSPKAQTQCSDCDGFGSMPTNDAVRNAVNAALPRDTQ